MNNPASTNSCPPCITTATTITSSVLRSSKPLSSTASLQQITKLPALKYSGISGYKAKETAWIYFGAASPASTPLVKMFVRHPSGEVDISKDGQSNWVSVSDDPADCLIVAVYPPIDIHEGDILMVNPTKYLKAGTGSSADLAIFSIVPRLDPKLWEIHSAGVLQGDNLPLLFRQFISQEKQNDPGQLITDEALNRWLSWLDTTQKSGTTDQDHQSFPYLRPGYPPPSLTRN